jgi:hypothetical protein
MTYGLTRHPARLALATALLASAACADATATRPAELSPDALAASFASTPVGYGDLSTSFVATPAMGFTGASIWVGGGMEARMEHGSMMGGGLAEGFIGGIGFERGAFGHRGPFGGGLACSATFTNGRLVCPPVTFNGLTIARSAAYTTASGAVQQAFDSLTTNTVNLQTSVQGTVTFARGSDSTRGGMMGDDHGRGGHHEGWGMGRGGPGRLLGDTATILTATTTVNNASDQTVTGLAQGSTQRTVNAASRGQESTTGTSSRGAFTASRTVGDTTRGLVVPVRTAGSTSPTYPTAGTVIRSMQATLAFQGQSQVTASRREVVTYDGSATAKVTITENGTTRTCTRPLPRGPLSCS